MDGNIDDTKAHKKPSETDATDVANNVLVICALVRKMLNSKYTRNI